MIGWALVLVLGADDWACDFEAKEWARAGLQPPCRVLVGAKAKQLAAAQKDWGLTPEQASCALEAKAPPATPPATEEEWERRQSAQHLAWRRCAEQWPQQPVFWRAAVLSWDRRTPWASLLDKLPPAPSDGGRALADELLDLGLAPHLELVQWLVRSDPQRLASLLRDRRVEGRARFELALLTLDTRAPTAAEWDALAEPLVKTPLLEGNWLFAAEQWLRLPEAVRARASVSPELALLYDLHEGDLRPRLALGLLAVGKPEEARRIKFAPDEEPNSSVELFAEAARWLISGQRTTSPWDAAISAATSRSLRDWEAWAALMPFLHPHEAMFADRFARRARSEDDRGPAKYGLSPAIAARLSTSSARSRQTLDAQLHFSASQGVAAQLPDALPSPFVERTAPWKGAAPKARALASVKGRLPAGFWPVRVETQGRRTVVLALSQRLDPVGEVSPGGYWLLVSTDGARWEELYLALGDHRPFRAHEQAKVPLLGADDVVRLAMEEAPIDERSITFPPIGTSAPTKRALVVLEAPLAALRSDADRDGLSDLVEARLLLDPKSRDTDGDGVIDGDDPTPRLDDRLPATPRAEMLNAFFEDFLTGRREPPAAIVGPGQKGVEAAVGQPRPADLEDVRFIEGAASELAGLRPLIRLINLDPRELEAARGRFGAFYPMHLQLELNGKDHAFLEWSEGWRGGSLRIDREPSGKLVMTQLTSWIT